MRPSSLLFNTVSLILCKVVLAQVNLTLVEEFINATGGAENYLSSIHQMEQAASDIRTGIPCYISNISTWRYGAYGIVGLVTFEDGEKWAVKISADPLAASQGVNALKAIERHCPELPVPKIWGEMGFLVNETYMFYFMDWLQGTPLYKDIQTYQNTSEQYHRHTNQTSVHVPSMRITIHNKTITDLAEFRYNLTMCPIPDTEMATYLHRRIDPLLAPNNISWTLPHTSTWLRAKFIFTHDFLSSNQSSMNLSGLDKFLMLIWALDELSQVDPSLNKFSLRHFDLEPQNILVDSEHNLVGIIDWDSTVAIPLMMTVYSLNHQLFFRRYGTQYPELQRKYLDETQDTFFRKEFYRLDEERSSSDRLAKASREPDRYYFLLLAPYLTNEILDEWSNNINDRLPNLLNEALNRSPTRLGYAAEEWKRFSDDFYTKRGRPVPDWPMYVEIQKDLGIYKTAHLPHFERLLKRTVHRRLGAFLEVICMRYPQWKWAARKNCYHTAALWNKYKLPSGRYSC